MGRPGHTPTLSAPVRRAVPTLVGPTSGTGCTCIVALLDGSRGRGGCAVGFAQLYSSLVTESAHAPREPEGASRVTPLRVPVGYPERPWGQRDRLLLWRVAGWRPGAWSRQPLARKGHSAVPSPRLEGAAWRSAPPHSEAGGEEGATPARPGCHGRGTRPLSRPIRTTRLSGRARGVRSRRSAGTGPGGSANYPRPVARPAAQPSNRPSCWTARAKSSCAPSRTPQRRIGPRCARTSTSFSTNLPESSSRPQ